MTPVEHSVARRVPVRSEADPRQSWAIANEVPVEVGFNGQPWTVMLATPAHLEDLATGLALTEGAISNAEAIQTIDVRHWPDGITADIQLPEAALNTDRLRRRNLDGRTGCGLCGVETLADLHRERQAKPHRIKIEDSAVTHALEALTQHQALNRMTRSVHAAAWCEPNGTITQVREDVGRHNALDKLVGALARAKHQSDGFILMSSRCSYELVAKAATAGASLLASVSAPTGLALDFASALALPLAVHGPGGAIVRFEETINHG